MHLFTTPPPVAGDGTVHVLHLPLAAFAGVEADLAALLSPQERARAATYAFPHLVRRFVTRRGLLRSILGAVTGEAPQSLRLSTGVNGKPLLEDFEGLAFNLADSEDDAIVALRWGGDLGVDIERMRAVDDADRIVEQSFSTRERQHYRTLPPAERPRAFLRAWTRKEAVLKAIGIGLSRPLDSFDVELRPGRPAAMFAIAGGSAADWWLADVSRDAERPAALCARVPAAEIVQHAVEMR